MPVAAILKPHVRDLGGFEVRRLVPAPTHRMIGPFVFFDHFGPVRFPPGGGIDVRPHPHIGLATISYLFEGAILHRDSLGSVQRIAPGDVNWMTAGHGIVHSERTAPEDRAGGPALHGLQTWIALPKAHERTEPAFSHHPKSTLPEIRMPGVHMRVVAGSAYGERAPVRTFSETLYVAIEAAAGACFPIPPEHEERALYILDGDATVDGQPIPVGHMAVLPASGEVEVRAATSSTLMLLGGAKMDGERHVWWNFVASSRDMIEEAKVRWREGRFPAVPGETEFIPLPDH